MEFEATLQHWAAGSGHWVKEVRWFCGGFGCEVVTKDPPDGDSWANQAETNRAVFQAR